MKKEFLRFTLFLLVYLSIRVTATAQTVDIPDPNLSDYIERVLGKAAGPPITVTEMAALTSIDLQEAVISDLTGLDHAINLTELHLYNNSISDISAVAGLTNLMGLFLNNNSISDITAVTGLTNLVSLNLSYNMVFDLSPLVANTGLGARVGFFVAENPLNSLSLHTHIPTLRERGVYVRSVKRKLLRNHAETELLWNYPNPFRLETRIPYRLVEDAFVTLTIYDLSGHVIRTLEAEHQIAGTYASRYKAAYWDGRNELGERIASGTYFYHLSAGDSSITRRMVILR